MTEENYSVQWGYGEDFVEINDSPVRGDRAQILHIPIGVFDQMVEDYLRNRREVFRAKGYVEGSHYDDDITGF